MTHNELLKEIDRYLVPTLAESEIGNKAIGILKALRAVVELHKPIQDEWFNIGELICEECTREEYIKKYPCSTIQAIEKELA